MTTRLVFASLLLSSFCFADLKYRMHTTGRSIPTPDRIVYVHGDRIRTEFPYSGRVNIRECDLNASCISIRKRGPTEFSRSSPGRNLVRTNPFPIQEHQRAE